MTEETLAKAYDFKSTEQRLYKFWEENGYFKAQNDPRSPQFDPSRKPFVISIPPPNVTGELHTGHAMFVSMEDLMIRYHRMKGIPTLWVPGTDHAGIATQMLVEKMLAKEGIKRDELGREGFLKRTWEWKEKYGSRITHQIRRLGASCDWEKERFTMDEGLSKAVREAFVRLFEKGLIYRGPRMINWSPSLRTAVSDLEVEYSEEPGFLYYFKYMLADLPGEYIPVATTRPETILGDTAVAVHPEDERYQKFIGKDVLVPILGRRIPVIADEYVDRAFGTGALKITPAHDPNDYTIGQTHNLEMINILNKDASINENGAQYAGMDRFECRKKLWEDMRAVDLVIKEQPYTLNVPRSQRGGEIVEPMISTQWFVKIQPLADRALASVKEGRTRIVPERFTKVYFNWLENIRDWCISRQLWWGHRIPVWYCDDCNAVNVSREDPTECAKCHSHNIHQDEDVLDTWFSSGLWPFSTLGWPEQTPELKYFYPTAVMETGADILFFWVARMMMFGLEFTDVEPFHTIYLHGLILDEKGQKMSKTKGNVVDPLVVMDDFGTDALRFTLLVGSTPGNDTNLSLKKVEANRNFANKIWNACRFVISNLEKAPQSAQAKPEWTLADSWIWARLKTLLNDSERLFENYQYGEAGRQIYEFFWGDFADWYLEIAKTQLAAGGDRAYYTANTLVRVMDASLRLLHPFTPFVTEELWQALKKAAIDTGFKPFDQKTDWESALIVAKWPAGEKVEGWEEDKMAQFAAIQDVVRANRNLRSEKKIQPNVKTPGKIVNLESNAIFSQEKEIIAALGMFEINNLEILKDLAEAPAGWTSTVSAGSAIYIPVPESAEDKDRLSTELAVVTSHIERLESLLGSDFANKAPAAVVDRERVKLAEFKESYEKLKAQLG
ncbi:MAG: valine--tRNA ligase [Chloroflexi bacterium HGW-Chloroflexi-5]|jgi:valyl-tRNA synthetase|nr:MAG: valine--tRNA ligase [Chloroflexi bacterium HGW-Chloroflexi-5]